VLQGDETVTGGGEAELQRQLARKLGVRKKGKKDKISQIPGGYFLLIAK